MSTSEPGATATSAPPPYREPASGNGGDQSTKQQAQEKAQEAAGQAKEQAQQAAGQAKDRARTLVDERSTHAGQQVSRQAGDLRAVSQKLREEGKEGPAKIADQAADRGERLGRYLEQSDADRILGDLEEFGRRQPWAIALGGLAVGFAASRFLKASSSQRYQARAGTAAPNRPALPRTTTPAPTAPPPPASAPTRGISSTGAPAREPGLAPEPPRTPESPTPPIPGRPGI